MYRVKLLHSLLDGGQVCRSVYRGAVGFTDDAGRILLLIALLRDVDDQRPLALMGIAVVDHHIQHGGYPVVDIRFAAPQLEMGVQPVVVLLHIRYGYFHDVMPERAIAAATVLELLSDGKCPLAKLRVLLGAGAGRGIYLLQISHGEGRLLGVAAGEALIEIRQLRLPALDLRYH